jgi:hypothetical protein
MDQVPVYKEFINKVFPVISFHFLSGQIYSTSMSYFGQLRLLQESLSFKAL